ncbi:MAG: hypothetical protein H6807_18070 [Planctomycetes bacterium]|nr:hypothetical protein [Planctomycetota bacterium]
MAAADPRGPRAGGLVLASHFWRGPRAHAPSAEDLVAAGIDGFGGRPHQELRQDARERQRILRELCRSRGLVATASSDFHGTRSGNYCWNLMRVSGADLADDLWRSLDRDHRGLLPVVLDSPLDRDLGPLMPPAVAWSYLRELGLGGRLGWLLWLAACVALIAAIRIRREGRTA